MTLTPEQKQAVSGWIAAGDNLSAVQKKLREQFSVSMTYMDVRFLVDDLNLELKDPAPKADKAATNDVSKAPAPKPAEKKGFNERVKEKAAAAATDDAGADGAADEADAEFADAELDDLPPEGGGSVTVEVDSVTLLPGALASGTVTFSDGVTGKWIVDHQGRPGFTEISQPGYRPNPTDAQAFMQELSAALQRKGF